MKSQKRKKRLQVQVLNLSQNHLVKQKIQKSPQQKKENTDVAKAENADIPAPKEYRDLKQMLKIQGQEKRKFKTAQRKIKTN